MTTEGAKLEQQENETRLEFAQRLVDADAIQGEARDELANRIKAYNEVQGESLVIQEKINNKIDENIIKQEAKRQKTIELMAKEDEKNQKDAAEVDKRLAREDALEVKLNENRTEKETKDEAARTKEIMGDMLVSNNKLLLAKQEQDINAKIAEQDEIDRNKKLEGWAKVLGFIGDYIGQVFNLFQGHYDLLENELNVTLANQKTANQEAYNEEIKALEDKFARGEISKEEYDAAILGTNQRFQAANKQAEIDQAKALNEIKKKEFEANKKNSLIQLGIDLAQAIIKSFVQLGWPLGLIPAAAMTAVGAIQANQIRQTEFVPTTFYQGGFGYTGAGNPHEVSNALGTKAYTYHKDEYIVPSRILNSLDGMAHVNALEQMRTGKKGFYSGGMSGGNDIAALIDKLNTIQYVMPVEELDILQQKRTEVREKAELNG